MVSAPRVCAEFHAERTEIVKPILCRDAPAGGERIDVEQIFAEIQHHTLGLRAGARGEQDDRIVFGPSRLRRNARRATRELGEQRIRLGLVRAPDPQTRGGRRGQQIVELQAVLIKNELRLEPLENIVELVSVHLDVDGAERRAVGHDAEIAQQLLDRIVGEQRNPVVRPKAALPQKRGEAADRVAQLAVADGAPIVGCHNPRLVRRGKRGARYPVVQQV